MPHATYHMLDVDLALSAPEEILRSFDLLYGRFRERCACEGCRDLERMAFRVDVVPSAIGSCDVRSPWGKVNVDADRVLTHLFFLLQNHVVGQVRGFFALHGAALEIAGRGCILAAPSATGKTTLAAALAQRGAGFLSDEIAALDLRKPVLHGFHRHLAVRQPARGLLGREDDPIVEIAGETKSVIDPGRLENGEIRTCARPDVVILLVPLSDPSAAMAEDEQILEVFLLREGDGFASRVESIHGVRSVHRLDGRRLPGLRIVQDREAALMDAIDSRAQATGTLISGHHRGASLPIDYALPPQCERLENSAGLMQLLPAILNRNGLHHLGSPVQWLFALSRHLAATRFYRMTPGRLKETVEAIERLCASEA